MGSKMKMEDREFHKLNDTLHRLIAKTDIRAKLGKLSPHTAESTWVEGSGRIDIKADPQTVGSVTALVHEMLHYWLSKSVLKKDIPYALEEPMVDALESKLMEFLQKDKRRMNWWRWTVKHHFNR